MRKMSLNMINMKVNSISSCCRNMQKQKGLSSKFNNESYCHYDNDNVYDFPPFSI
jgi:hypothetical protein